MQKPRVLVIVGPTGSGKSALALKLTKKFSGEIISADSRQIYRGMDIGTAKPLRGTRQETRDKETRNKGENYVSDGIIHHLIDIRNPDQPHTVAEYRKECIAAIKRILKKEKLPIMVGGTGLYIKAVVDNLNIPKVKADPKLRVHLEQELKVKGTNYLYKKLIELDPEAAYVVDRYNPRRIIRALEVTLKNNKPFSQTRRQGKPLFDFLQLGIKLSQQELKDHINKRVNQMIKAGLVEEVKNLIRRYPAENHVFDAIGYREIINYLEGEYSLNEAVNLIKKHSWQFARRQLTWFRKDKRIHWITTPKEAEKLIKEFFT